MNLGRQVLLNEISANSHLESSRCQLLPRESWNQVGIAYMYLVSNKFILLVLNNLHFMPIVTAPLLQKERDPRGADEGRNHLWWENGF